ncbi:methyl-cpg-binding domain-containing protein 7 [Quercus suber]|uniref:Methyl-cpg-binding domain-containing protein 7 n=1 Tax=Quercus suber TaxID=58331 RepID=A0AAW0K1P9_QUESU
MPISCNCSDEISSNRLTMAKIGVGINSDGLMVKLMEYNSSCLDGKSSDSPAVDGLEMQIVVRTIKSTSHFKLPVDWVIEEKPRSNANYAGIIDKYYIKPGTGQWFRSLVAVERYLTQTNENTATPKALKPGDQASHYCGLRKKIFPVIYILWMFLARTYKMKKIQLRSRR